MPLIEPHDDAARQRIGLSLSGGGFGAALFHIGVLARLADLDLLRRVDVLSCVSGGSIIGALYYLYLKRALDAHGEVDSQHLIEMIGAMEQHFLAAVQKNLRWQALSSLASNVRLARTDYSRTDRFGALLDRHLYRPIFGGDQDRPVEMRTLAIHPRGQRDFNPITDNAGRHCRVPMLMINATTLNSGRNWCFGIDRMGEPPRTAMRRQMDKNWQLCQSRYNGLAHDYAGMQLGHAVAASAATPGMIDPLPLSRLYPDPERPKRHLHALLADGGMVDGLGTEVLVERGCTHFLVSDASTQLADLGDPDTRAGPITGRSRDILLARLRELQLARLQEKHPRHVAVMHMMREVATPELKPIGPADHGHIIKDRSDTEITSYGVERRVQSLLCRMRTDVDAFSDTEALALMADGYLVTRRTFEELDQQGQSWTDGLGYPAEGWRFAALFDALRQPSPLLLKRLDVARYRFFKGQRLVPRLRFEAGLLLSTAVLGLGALLTSLTSGRIGVDPSTLALIAFGLLLAVLACPAYQALSSAAGAVTMLAWLKGPLKIMGRAATLAMALPLYLVAGVQLYAGRLFLKAGELPMIGIEPILPMTGSRPPEETAPEDQQSAKKAA